LYSLEGHENTISSLVLLRNEFLGSSSWDCTCKIWNLETRSCIYTLKGHKDIVWSFIELKNGELATCSNDKNIIIWEKN
jgi:WD40 repeat protein